MHARQHLAQQGSAGQLEDPNAGRIEDEQSQRLQPFYVTECSLEILKQHLNYVIHTGTKKTKSIGTQMD